MTFLPRKTFIMSQLSVSKLLHREADPKQHNPFQKQIKQQNPKKSKKCLSLFPNGGHNWYILKLKSVIHCLKTLAKDNFSKSAISINNAELSATS